MSYFQVEEVMSVGSLSHNTESKSEEVKEEGGFVDENLAICPVCKKKSLRMENGCHSCLNSECGFSKCDT